jgi:hypothetical protein
MEKVISEWRIVETDDGFRIEIKGDKEAMRERVKRMFARGPMPFGHHWPFGARRWYGGHGFGMPGWQAEKPHEPEK